MFDSPEKLLLGLFSGILFGILLQKGQVAKFQIILGQMLLKNWIVFKIMGTAIIVGSIGVYALVQMGAADLHVKPAAWAGIITGGVIFGAGMTILGYCPGTAVAACGEGSVDARFGVLGMFVGALTFVAVFDWAKPFAQSLGSMGKVTLPGLTNSSPWLWIVGLSVLGIAAFVMTRKGKLHGVSI